MPGGFMMGLLAAGLLLCAGCAKQPSSYVPQTAYVYDDSQDVNRTEKAEDMLLPEAADPESSAKLVKESASEEIGDDKDSTREKDVAVQPDSEDPESTEKVRDREGKQNDPATEKVREKAETDRQNDDASIKDANKSGERNEDRKGQVIDANAAAGDISGTDAGKRTEAYPDENGEKAADISDDKEEKNRKTEEEIDQPEKEEQKEKDSAGKGDDEKDQDAKSGEEGKEKTDKGGEKESAATLDPEKVVSLSYEGELGTYIWGEAVDLSELTVTAVYEDGHKEPVSDYVINMNYPALQDIGVYSYECMGGVMTMDNYTPGTYYATIAYNGTEIEVPYRLIIMYGLLLVDHRAECRDPEGHHADQDEYGHYRCRNCGYPSVADPESVWIGEGHVALFPLLYDYVLTEDDIRNSSFFSGGVDLGSYYFSGFPVVYDKHSGKDESRFGPDRYSGTGGAAQILGHDYFAFRGNSPASFEGQEVEVAE